MQGGQQKIGGIPAGGEVMSRTQSNYLWISMSSHIFHTKQWTFGVIVITTYHRNKIVDQFPLTIQNKQY